MKGAISFDDLRTDPDTKNICTSYKEACLLSACLLSASALRNGCTVHTSFKLPLNLNANSKSAIEQNTVV